MVDADYIKDHKGEFTLVDVRAAREFADGHIPGAVNIEYSPSSDDADKIVAEVQRCYEGQGLEPNDPIVVYCRTGVHAKAAADALAQAGYTDVGIYEGSWADWSSDADNPVSYD